MIKDKKTMTKKEQLEIIKSEFESILYLNNWSDPNNYDSITSNITTLFCRIREHKLQTQFRNRYAPGGEGLEEYNNKMEV